MKTKIFTAFFILFLLTTTSFSQIGGYALKFDGTDDYVGFTSGSDQTVTNITIEAWVNPASTSARQIFTWVKKTATVNVLEFRLTSTNQLEFGINNGSWGSLNTTSTIEVGKWTHVAVTKSGSSVLLYINGKQAASGTINKNPVVNQFELGYYQDDASAVLRPFYGSLDEVRIWTSVRTEAQIKANMFKEISTDANLIGYYKMSDGSGTTLTDNSGNSKTGTLTNGPLWKASGCFAGSRQALDFDGTDDYVNIPNSASVNITGTAITLEAWIYPTDLGTYSYQKTIIGKDGAGNGYVLRHGGGKLDFVFGNGGWPYVSSSSDAIKINSWQHVAAVYNGSTMKIYVNGVEVGSASETSSIQNFASYALYIGESSGFSGRRFTGSIDEVRIWNVARTANEIRENMMTNLIGNESGLAAYYRFDQTDGTTLYDMTANGNNGTLTNMDAATDWVSSSAFNTWIGSESSTWSTAANWSSGSAPTSTDNLGLYKWNLGNEATISGAPTVNSIFFSSAASPTLSSNLTVNGSMVLEKNVNLNGQTITLGENGYLDEGSNRLYGSSGTITTTRNLQSMNSVNIGGLGAVLTTGTSVVVSGAGTSVANGTYCLYDVYNGKNRYKKGDYQIYFETELEIWVLAIDDTYLYHNFSTNNEPPASGWEYYSGFLPVPTMSVNTYPFPGNTTITRGHTQQNSGGLNGISRFYTITPTTNTGLNATLVFKYNDNELGSVIENTLVLFKSTDNGSTWTKMGGTKNTTDNTVTLSGIDSFSKWTLGAENSPLPVELTSFKASYSEQKVTLNWQTATEINNYGFEIQRLVASDLLSANSWQKIAFVQGHGNSNSPKSYTFVDANPPAGKVQYRLKQIDFDGKYEYSDVVEVNVEAPATFLVKQNYPNPFNPSTVISYQLPVNSQVTLQVYDVLGREVATLVNETQKAGVYNINFNASHLASGIYMYKVQAGSYSQIKKMLLVK